MQQDMEILPYPTSNNPQGILRAHYSLVTTLTILYGLTMQVFTYDTSCI